MGKYHTIVKQVSQHPLKYFSYFRMSKNHFDYIYSIISPKIKPSINTFRKDKTPAKEKLVLTLSNWTQLHRTLTTIFNGKINRRGMYQPNKYLKPIALPQPSRNDWLRISSNFHTRWNFPNCLGAVGGKRIVTLTPNNLGSLNCNYHRRFSTVLMALVDAKYKFITVDIGAYDSSADSSIFKSTKFGKIWLNNPEQLDIPHDASSPGTDEIVPYVLVGDKTFSLNSSLLTPYPRTDLSQIRRIFNYRLSRARRIVDNAFENLSGRWRILLKRLEVKHHDTMNNIVLSCVILHNLVKTNEDALGNSPTISYPVPASSKCSVPGSRGYDIRDKFANWCINEGDVPFQYQLI